MIQKCTAVTTMKKPSATDFDGENCRMTKTRGGPLVFVMINNYRHNFINLFIVQCITKSGAVPKPNYGGDESKKHVLK